MNVRKYIVTHDQKKRGPDPGMTIQGLLRIARLRPFLDALCIAAFGLTLDGVSICIGTGQRHMDMVEALSLNPRGNYEGAYERSEFAGPADSYEVIEGMKSVWTRTTEDDDWSPVDYGQYEGRRDADILNWLLNTSAGVILGSREIIKMLLGTNIGGVKSGAIYAVDFFADHNGDCLEVTDVRLVAPLD